MTRMDELNDLIERIETECSKEKGVEVWMDEVIDEAVLNAKYLLYNFPSLDVLRDVEVVFCFEDHHDGLINIIFITCKDKSLNGLCVMIDHEGYSVEDEDGEPFSIWNIDEDTDQQEIAVIASEVYATLKNIISEKKKRSK